MALSPFSSSNLPACYQTGRFSLPVQPSGLPMAPSALPRPVCSAPHGRPKHQTRDLLMAGGLLGVAAFSHRWGLPARVPGDGFKTMLPADWKVWARVLMGVGAVHKLNQSQDWKLPPWLGALETLGVVSPLVMGLELKKLLPSLVMAPVVAGAVQGASLLNSVVEKPAQRDFHIPPIVSQIGLSVVTGIAALLIYPPLYRQIAKTGIIGKDLKKQAEEGVSAFASMTFTSCARGCSPGSFICLSELADIGGSISLWVKDQLSGNSKQPQTRRG